MTLESIILLTLEKLGIKEDVNITNSLVASINEGYMKLNKENPALVTSYIPIINEVATLPENFVEIINITPALNTGDRQIGNSIVTSNKGTFKILHSYLYEPLVEMTDEPMIPSFLHSHLSNYACYCYLQSANPNLAVGFLNDFERVKEEYKTSVKKGAFSKNAIQDYYTEFNLGSDY